MDLSKAAVSSLVKNSGSVRGTLEKEIFKVNLFFRHCSKRNFKAFKWTLSVLLDLFHKTNRERYSSISLRVTYFNSLQQKRRNLSTQKQYVSIVRGLRFLCKASFLIIS